MEPSKAFNIVATLIELLNSLLDYLGSLGVDKEIEKIILADMLIWALDNHSPANYLLISGNPNFAPALNGLRSKGYNILLACPPNVSEVLLIEAKSVWSWKDLAGGQLLNEALYNCTASKSLHSDISRVTVSQYPSSGGYCYNSSFNKNVPFYNQRMQRPRTPVVYSNMLLDRLWNNPAPSLPSFEVHTILHALQILKADGIVPTEENIADCIHYGKMNAQSFNIKAALDCAVQYQIVVMHGRENNLPLYVPKNEAIWECSAKQPKAILDVIYKFLSSAVGCESPRTLQSRYLHAATTMRDNCLKYQFWVKFFKR